MYDYLKRLFFWFLPILRQASLEVAADVVNDLAGGPRRTRRLRRRSVGGYTRYDRMASTRRVSDDWFKEQEMLAADAADAALNDNNDYEPDEATAKSEAAWDAKDTTKFYTGTWAQKIESGNYHDVLMVAFDITGPTKEEVHQWLRDNMPKPNVGGYIRHRVLLDDFWIADDGAAEDRGSAVFVHHGKQAEARAILRDFGLMP